VQILKDVLPDFEATINTLGKDLIRNSNLKMVHKIVDSHLSGTTSISTNISRLHRSDEKRLCFEAAFLLLFSNREEADEFKIRTIPIFLQRLSLVHYYIHMIPLSCMLSTLIDPR
jgi:uncharacterized protein YigA (DUF484 family)